MNLIKFVGFDLLIHNQEISFKNFQPWFYQDKEDTYYLKSLINSSEGIYSNFPIINLDEDNKDFSSPIFKRSLAWMNFIIQQINKQEKITQQDMLLFTNNMQHLSIYNLINYNNQLDELYKKYLSFIEPFIIVIDNIEYSNIQTLEYSKLIIKKSQKNEETFLRYLDDNQIICFISPNNLAYGNFNEFINDISIRQNNYEHTGDWTFEYKKYEGEICVLSFNNMDEFFVLKKNKLLLLPPNNNDERNSIGALFRDNYLKCELNNLFEKKFVRQCPWYQSDINESIVFINEVFKYNLYINNNANFNYHFDTMFTSISNKIFSIFSLIMYFRVENEHTLYYKYQDHEYQIKIKPNTIFLIPHFIEHKVIGNGLREFIKTEISFNFDSYNLYFDEDISKLFDSACNDLRYSVIFPELKTLSTTKFNMVNKFRFQAITILPTLPSVYVFTTLSNTANKKLSDIEITYGSDYEYYYFKVKNLTEKIQNLIKLIILNDLFPTKFSVQIDTSCLPGNLSLFSSILKLHVKNNQLFYNKEKLLNKLTYVLDNFTNDKVYHHFNQFGQLLIIPLTPITFASCQCDITTLQTYLTNITFSKENYFLSEINNKENDIIKINKLSFKNGIVFSKDKKIKNYNPYNLTR